MMLRSFSVERFRGLAHCKIEGMRRVTLFTGKNNVGKTAILEAIFVHSGRTNPSLVMIVNGVRGMGKFAVDFDPDSEPPWASVFSSYDDSHPVRLSGVVESKPGQSE